MKEQAKAKPIHIGLFMGEVDRLLRNLPNIGTVWMPFCRSQSVKQILSLKTPPILIFLKILSLAISLFVPFMLQQVYHNLHDSQYLYKLIFVVLFVGLLRIFTESSMGWMMSQMQLNFKRILGRELIKQELLSKHRDRFDELWVLINNDANMIGNYHNSFLSTYYEVARMLFAGVYLYYKMKMAVFVGLLVGMLLAKLNFKVAQNIGVLYDELVVLRAKKIKIISFLTNRVQELKMCRLEDYIYRKMLKIREQQFQNLTYSKLLDAFCVWAWQITSVLISSVSFVIYILYFRTSTTDTSFNIMTIITFFSMLIMPLNMLPWSFVGMGNGRNSRDRIAKEMTEIGKVRSAVQVREKKDGQEVSVEIGDGVVDAYADFQLKVHHMKLEKGKVYAVKGVFGAGKSLFSKSLVHLLNSNYPCTITGKVGYVQPTSYHLHNALCSIYDSPDISEIKLTQQLKDLMVSFHCLEIPVKNQSETFSGGEKLRLGLVRATMGRDVIVIDCSLESLDDKVRKYIEIQMRDIAKSQGKIFIVESQVPLSDKSIEIKDREVRMIDTPEFKNGISNQAHQKQKLKYRDEHPAQLSEMFNMQQPKLALGPTSINLKYFKTYYKSPLHILFILSMIALYSMKNFYNYYTVNFIKTDPHFVTNIIYLVVAYILIVMARSVLFAKANLSQAKRMVEIIIKNICYDGVDMYREKGAQEISLTYTDSCEALGNGYPFHANILFNNIFEFIFTLGMILLHMPYAIVPSLLLLIYFKKTQLYFRVKTHGLQDMSKHANLRLLQVVQNTAKGKTIIVALKDQQKYINQFDKWNDNFINCKASVALLDKWLAQRYQLITLWLMIFILFIVYHYFDKFEMQSKGLSIVITYCVDLADKLGYLVKSVAEAEREGRNIRKFTQYNKGDDEMDLDRMTHEIKNQISHNEKGPQELALENLWFKYPGEKVDILRGLSLNVKSQEKIMIKGKTGAGKTTLFKILTKVYLPKEKLNRGYIAFSPQKPLLLIDATLQENLDPYGLISKDVLQPYINKFSTSDVQKLTNSEQLRVNMYRAELYGRNSVIVYDEPGMDVCKNATCIIVSHHGDYQVDKKYELKDGVLLPLQ